MRKIGMELSETLGFFAESDDESKESYLKMEEMFAIFLKRFLQTKLQE